jgi:flagellin
MTSILTNNAATAALSTLRSISSDMETTQSRISSGYKVESASDNAAYWSISTTMRSDNKALGTVQDALGLGAATTDVAYTALEASIDVVDEIKAKITAATEPGVDKAKVQKEITQLQDQLMSIAKSASFSGENWVYHEEDGNEAGTQAIVGSFNRDSEGNVSLTTLEYNTEDSSLVAVDSAGEIDTSGGGMLSSEMTYVASTGSTASVGYSLLELDIEDMDTTSMAEALSGVDAVLQKMTDAAADVGALTARIELQDKFVADLMDSIETGVGKLVDADMNEESTRLKALQTQQQLGIQALSIANSDSQNILSLFR